MDSAGRPRSWLAVATLIAAGVTTGIAASIAASLDKAFSFSSADEPDQTVLYQAYNQIRRTYDAQLGGFDGAPKFPTPHRLLFLLRYYHQGDHPHALEMVEKTLTAMRLGGIWDHVGFGFHRYAIRRQPEL